MTSRSCWKGHERKVAKALGGGRIPCSGSGDIKGDVLHDTFFVECKVRKKLAILPWMLKAEEQARPLGKIPLLVVRQKGTREGELVVMRLKHFTEIVKHVPKPNSQQLQLAVKGNDTNGGGRH